MIPFPFSQSDHGFQRRTHGPQGYMRYQAYKTWLRDEYCYRCVYCLSREKLDPNGHANYGVDHLVPKSRDLKQLLDYSNLVYACNSCNSRKNDCVLPSCLLTQSFINHIRFLDTGVVEPLSPEGDFLVDMLLLNDQKRVEYRKFVMEILAKANLELLDNSSRNTKIIEAFGYPEFLDDLRRARPPGGNSRSAGLKNSAFVLRELGKLPRFV